MNTLLRTLTLWLVLLAVPFQGFAAAAMPGCASGHGAPAPAAAVAAGGEHAHHAMHGAGGHAMAAPDGHDNHHAGHDAGHGSVHVSSHPTGHDAGHHAGQHHGNAKCGACSVCSIGASMAPAAIPALPVHAPPLLPAPFAAGYVPSVDLALPERPPRFFLA